jgi:hypothetical protein
MPFVIDGSYIVRIILFNIHILHEDLKRNTIEGFQVVRVAEGVGKMCLPFPSRSHAI